MIQLVDQPPPPQALSDLAAWQSAVDSAGAYGRRVAKAKSLFKSKNTAKNGTFVAVRCALTAMCAGSRRCNYCEDSMADEVEHIRPKDLYPESAFVWTNYVYACGPCNGPKNSKFSVFDAATGHVADVSRARKAPIVPPAPGSPVLIDPRADDPLAYLHLDLVSTFYFVPTDPPGTSAYRRAEYTLAVLHLNDRDMLVQARAGAYVDYTDHLTAYIARRDSGAAHTELDRITARVRTGPHPTVWREMVRQQSGIPELAALFGQAPEALAW